MTAPAPVDPVELTIVGHASLYLKAGRTDLLVDPWLHGSCYWRSWWHFPSPAALDDSQLSPAYVYLSHHHFDHFHYPSLRRVDRRTHVLVPRYGVDVMRAELAGLGFERVTELRHGRPFELGDGLELRSYQYGVDDSALVVRRGDTVVADLNDCKIRRRALAQIRADNGPATLMLKNYSAAQAYPGCYQATDAADLQLISRRGYLVDFRDAAAGLGARHAVPFASMTCFLHPETMDRNAEVILPGDLERFFADNPLPGTELVVMAPGDRWSESAGFDGRGGDAYAEFEPQVAEMAEEARPRIAASLADEAARPLTFERFRAYFESFVQAVPYPVRRLFKGSIPFRVGDEYWVVDVRHRAVGKRADRPADGASVVTAPPGVLADAIDKRIVNFVHISMRLSVELAPGGVGTDFLFWGILTIFELGYLPLRRLRPGRMLMASWDRRRELVDSAAAALGGKGSGLERMAGSLMPTGTDPAALNR